MVNPSSGKVMKKVTVNPTPTESKEVTAGTGDITVLPDEEKLLSSVTVHPTPSQSKTVTPGKSSKTVSPDSGKLLSRVIVNGDSDLVADNIRKNINIFGVLGTLVEGVAGIDFGEVTLASTAESVTVSHNLGVIPSFVALIPKTLSDSTNYDSYLGFNDKVAIKTRKTVTTSSSLVDFSDCENTLTTNEITFNIYGTYPWYATDYYWFAIA